MSISRRAFLAVTAAAAACTRRTALFQGYAFVANREGGTVAAVDLGALAVAKHIPLDGAPAQVIAAGRRPSVYALAPESGSVHEIYVDQLRFARKVAAGSALVAMHLAPDEKSLYVLAREPKALISINLDSFRVEWRLPLPAEPVDFAVTGDGKTAAVSFASGVRTVDLAARRLSRPMGAGEFGPVKFLSDSKTLIAANRGSRQLSLYDVATGRLITHLPVTVRPDQMCFNHDGGQLFVTGEGMDAVVIVYPYHTPEVAETVLAGHAPGAMAVSSSFLFVASPQSGDVSILNIPTRRVIAVVQVGADPGFIAVTPDDQYALVLNRKSGDISVLRAGAITPNRYKSAALLTVIPVGSRPVSAAIRAV
jgi:YVTN family beta-propeller protein